MPKPLPRLLAAAALLCLGAVSAVAEEADPCRAVSPRYEPKTGKPPGHDHAHFFGGGRLSRPVATPCPRAARPTDV